VLATGVDKLVVVLEAGVVVAAAVVLADVLGPFTGVGRDGPPRSGRLTWRRAWKRSWRKEARSWTRLLVVLLLVLLVDPVDALAATGVDAAGVLAAAAVDEGCAAVAAWVSACNRLAKTVRPCSKFSLDDPPLSWRRDGWVELKDAVKEADAAVEIAWVDIILSVGRGPFDI
jgi:hypothetical protein